VIIVDTNVTSELMKPSPSPAVTEWVRTRSAVELYTTSVTLAEIYYGIERMPAGRRKNLLRTAAEDVFSRFAEHVLAFDAPAAVDYARIVLRRDRAGTPIHGFDAQIAAICSAHNAALATRDVRDFQDTGIDLIDPWSDRGGR
jgi:predicted nucleic acid-binding protein